MFKLSLLNTVFMVILVGIPLVLVMNVFFNKALHPVCANAIDQLHVARDACKRKTGTPKEVTL